MKKQNHFNALIFLKIHLDSGTQKCIFEVYFLGMRIWAKTQRRVQVTRYNRLRIACMQAVVQWLRTVVCHAEGRGFESCSLQHYFRKHL